MPHHFGVVSDNTYNLKSLSSVLPSLIGLCGVYIIQNLKTGQEYVGSSLSLGDRLARYLQLSFLYLIFSLATDILISGRINFSIRIIVLKEETKTLELEQYFLDNCPMEYNEARKARNRALGFYKFYIYSAVSFAFLYLMTGVELCEFFDMSAKFSSSIYEFMIKHGVSSIIYKGFIISLVILTTDQITKLLPNILVRKVGHQISSKGDPIYGFNSSLGLYIEWPNLSKANLYITGSRDSGRASIRKKMNTKTLYHGWILQKKPFKKEG